MPVYDFESPERFVAGTVGPPGQRTFFLQAREGRRVVSVSCEKEQLVILADRLLDLLDDLAGEAGSDAAAAAYSDDGPLESPIEDEFRVTSLSLGWDGDRRVVLIEVQRDDDEVLAARAEGEESEDELEPESALRVVLGPAQARAFARRARAIVSAGRPPCPFCGGPLDPDGHVCPRANGYRR
ncbi:MAG TPA: DUF3090 family protein [Dermatophilaceae bacterium]|nr:DUF3090 family protein [Dermatophilaceae bacterium]